jgi:hypothetical protein
MIWFTVALTFFLALHLLWNHLDHRWLSGRIDDIEDRQDQNRAGTDERLERLEDDMGLANDWIRHLHDRTSPAPVTQPMPVIDPDDGPPTQPQSLVLVREWSRDLEGPAEAWPQEPDGVESRSFGAHTFRFRTAEPLSPSAQE